MKALGMIETRGLVAAIEAVDMALKTASVELVNRHIVKGGIVTVELSGDVGAIKEATEAGALAAKRLGGFISSHVIARPDDMVIDMIEKKEKLKNNENIVMENKEGNGNCKNVDFETKDEVVEKIEEKLVEKGGNTLLEVEIKEDTVVSKEKQESKNSKKNKK